MVARLYDSVLAPMRSGASKIRDMKPQPLRVIFDRSAFHGARFRQLKDSRLKDLCRSGRMKVYHTPVFLNETISTYRPGEQDADWQTHLRFALDTCNGGIFLNKEDLWYQELVVGRGPRSRYICYRSVATRTTSGPAPN